MAKITIQRLWNKQEIEADVFGSWAVHPSVNRGADWAITHIPSGLVLGDVIGWAEFDREAALLVAFALDKHVPQIPLSVWGQMQTPKSDARDWACLVESVAAEVLAEVCP